MAWPAGDCAISKGEMVSVQGEVEVQQAAVPGWHQARLGNAICAGDRVRTGRNSRAAILLTNETLLRLDQQTTVTFPQVETDKPSWLDLLKGALYFISRTPKALTIGTPFVNAGIEGTEFAIRVGSDRTDLWVFEGKVVFSNARGKLTLGAAEAAVAQDGQAPRRRIVIRPRDAVQWTLYYPPLTDLRSAGRGAAAQAIQESLVDYDSGDVTLALARLERAPAKRRDVAYHNFRGALLLSAGRLAEASADFDRALRLNPDNAIALAWQSLIAVARNENEEALSLARRAATADPKAPIPRTALSYAYQASFDLDKALESAEQATRLDAKDAMAWARLAELYLSKGELNQALKAAREAAARNPRVARTQSVLGFAHLTRIEIPKALAAFEQAIKLDQADPLPRLGLGLAKIRKGELADGREEIEIAAGLDPNNSLIRSYLGKAYFDEKRDLLATSQFQMAEKLDSRDPTPWFYDAILKQTENRPVEALDDLQRSVELNGNRAVYRSRLLLDEDLAARSASLGRIYGDLGFEQLALGEGWESVSIDPSNFSAHRLLADSYAGLPRHEIARVSELLQSQLLQPINLTPLQPQLATTNLLVLEGAGPAALGFNEFNPLFTRNRLALQASGVVGGNDSLGDEVIFSGVHDKLSFSLGQFHYETDGFRPNNDLQTDIYSAFGQYSFTPQFSAQVELRRERTEAGDLREFANPDFQFENLRQEDKRDSARVGLRWSLAPGSDLLASFAYKEASRDTYSLSSDVEDLFAPSFRSFAPLFPGVSQFIDRTNDVDGASAELQYIKRWDRMNLLFGGGYIEQDRRRSIRRGLTLDSPLSPALQQDLETAGLPPFLAPLVIEAFQRQISETQADLEDSTETQSNAYLYSILEPFDNLQLTLGASVQSSDRDSERSNALDWSRVYIGPKVGAIWEPMSGTRIRAAWLRRASGPTVGEQTIEPTQVAGFNQLFDDGFGARFERYGVGLDQRLSLQLHAGLEATRRNLKVPRFVVGSNFVPDETIEIHQNELAHRAYLYWTPTSRIAASAQYFYEEFDRGPLSALDNGTPLSTKLHRIPLSLGYFHPRGFFAELTTTYVDQDVELRDDSKTSGRSEEGDRFWTTDVFVGYRLPKRFGILQVGVKNLFNEKFKYQDASPDVIGDLEGDLLPPLFAPERMIFAQITLAL